jgi:uncharacterized membrane protein
MAVRAVPLPNESATLNNELTSFLTVYEGGLRVLFITGVDQWEQSRLKRAIPAKIGSDDSNAQGIEIEFFPIYDDERTRQMSWPLGGKLTEAIRNPAVDVIIINGVDSRALFQSQTNEANLLAIEEAVSRGKGLMMLGGAHSFGPGLYHSTPLANVLPVTMNEFDRQEFDRDVRTELHIPGPVELVPVIDHPLVHLRDEQDFRQAWSELPPLPGANRFASVKDLSDVTVLLASKNNDPLLVAGNYGGGRVLAFAGDSTWLWYNHGFREEHKRFWQQVILWLAFPDGSAKDSVRVFLGQRRFQPLSPVTFTTEARTVTGQTIPDADYSATLISPTGTETPIPIGRTDDQARGTVDAEALDVPGIYAIRVAAERGTEKIGETEVEFSIYDQDKEKSNPAADPQLLERLANQTKDFGGKTVLPEQLGDLLDQLASESESLDVYTPQRWQLGQTATDSAIFLGLFVLCLATEWFFRKRWGLV